MSENSFGCTVADYLGLQAARLTATNHPVAVLALRLCPFDSHKATAIPIVQDQLVRLRDDINAVLRDPENWLHLADEQSANAPVPEGFDNPVAAFESPADRQVG